MFDCIIAEKEEISGFYLEEAFNALVHIRTCIFANLNFKVMYYVNI